MYYIIYLYLFFALFILLLIDHLANVSLFTTISLMCTNIWCKFYKVQSNYTARSAENGTSSAFSYSPIPSLLYPLLILLQMFGITSTKFYLVLFAVADIPALLLVLVGGYLVDKYYTVGYASITINNFIQIII